MKVCDTIKDAQLSPCRKYRFLLSRRKTPDEGQPIRTVVFILNNPSVADASIDDPTVRRGWGFTEAWGYNRMVFVNTNPYRATNPKAAARPESWARVDNHVTLGFLATPHTYPYSQPPLVVCAWGDDAMPDLARLARDAFTRHDVPVYHLGILTKAGNPRHILYLKGDLQPTVWQQ